jgi:hypothetical protein
MAVVVPPPRPPARSAPLPAEAAAPAPRWTAAVVSTLDEVERLLGRAERDGHREHELTVLGPNVFVVRWR